MFTVFILWIIFAIVAGVVASNKNRSVVGWILMVLILTPLSLLILLALPSLGKKVIEGLNKKCPYCAEVIKAEAVVCRYCGKELSKSDTISVSKNIALPEEDINTPENYIYGIIIVSVAAMLIFITIVIVQKVFG